MLRPLWTVVLVEKPPTQWLDHLHPPSYHPLLQLLLQENPGQLGRSPLPYRWWRPPSSRPDERREFHILGSRHLSPWGLFRFLLMASLLDAAHVQSGTHSRVFTLSQSMMCFGSGCVLLQSLPVLSGVRLFSLPMGEVAIVKSLLCLCLVFFLPNV